MSAEEKKVIQRIAEAAAILPDDERKYILGYAEGVIAMRGQTAQNPSNGGAMQLGDGVNAGVSRATA